MYIPSYLQSLTQTEIPLKIGFAAIASLLIAASNAYGTLFFVVVACWFTDILFGTLRVLKELLKPPSERTESFRWSKAGDGILRLIVIVVIPGLLAMVGQVLSDIVPIISPNLELPISAPGALASFAMAWMLVHEFVGAVNNATRLHPGLQSVKAKLVSWVPGEQIREEEVQVAIIRDKTGT